MKPVKPISKMSKDDLRKYTRIYCWVCDAEIHELESWNVTFLLQGGYMIKHARCGYMEVEAVLAPNDDALFLLACLNKPEILDYKRYETGG